MSMNPDVPCLNLWESLQKIIMRNIPKSIFSSTYILLLFIIRILIMRLFLMRNMWKNFVKRY